RFSRRRHLMASARSDEIGAVRKAAASLVKKYHPRKVRPADIPKYLLVFALRVLKGFRANQGLLLAGAVAYYTLLSLIPLLILMLIGLSHVIDQSRLLATMTEYLDFIVPGQSSALVGEL